MSYWALSHRNLQKIVFVQAANKFINVNVCWVRANFFNKQIEHRLLFFFTRYIKSPPRSEWLPAERKKDDKIIPFAQ